MTRVPLERSFQGYRIIQADKDDVELLGYLKLDVLGVRMLSSMRHALDEIARTEHVKVDLDTIPTDDEPTFELIRASDTLGCFQIESPGQRELLQKLQPTRWEDLIVDISLFRPGPVKSDMINPYLRRRAGMEAPTYAHPALRPALRETFGVIVYHEQVIRTLSAMAGYDLTYADHVRRHLDDEDLLPGFRAEFLERATALGVTADMTIDGTQEVELFATNFTIGDTDPTFLYGLTDVLGDLTVQAGETFVELEAAPADTTFKGVAFAPAAARGLRHT